ncbi:MAG: tRNA (adenosine(37)-N6)-threonylcarbamoyltransferase complex dimerization subunit type 1 TsaB [bacterium]
MKNLYINTCGKDVIIKYFKKTSIISEETVVGQKSNSQFIMPSIKKVLDGQIPEGIVVVVGPGSFTGVRLGVTIAKTFAYIKNIPIRTVTSLDEIAISVNSKEKNVAIVENNGYFVGTYDSDNLLIKELEYLSNEEFSIANKDNKYFVTTEIRYDKVMSFALKKEPENPHTIKPIYVKKIEVLK